MNRDYTWLRERAFGSADSPPTLVKYQAQQDLENFLQTILEDSRGAGVVYGPTLSGKKTIVRDYLAGHPDDVSVAEIDGSGMRPHDLMTDLLGKFGYPMDLASTDDLLQMLKVVVVQQTNLSAAPVVVIRNPEKMYPSALRILCRMATLTARQQFAIRFVLIAARPVDVLLQSDGMQDFARRVVGKFAMQPMTVSESRRYLHARLLVCGLKQPDAVFPVDVCERLHELSRGWPGLLNVQASAAMERAKSFPVRLADFSENHGKRAMNNTNETETSDEKPNEDTCTRLIGTWNGKTVFEVAVNEKKLLIGRSRLADITISNDYVSKYHLMLMLYDDALLLVDLKSSNGTLVNSRKVTTTILHSNDIISIGNHRIKVLNAPLPVESEIGPSDNADTATMKTLSDARQNRLRRFLRLAGVAKKKA